MAGVTQVLAGKTQIYRWTLTTADPTGEPVEVPEHADATVQAFGTFGGGTVAVEMSCVPDPRVSKWFAAKNLQGTDIGLTADGGSAVQERGHKLRPKLTGSAGASVDVYLLIG